MSKEDDVTDRSNKKRGLVHSHALPSHSHFSPTRSHRMNEWRPS
jgi:hypothetical protein